MEATHEQEDPDHPRPRAASAPAGPTRPSWPSRRRRSRSPRSTARSTCCRRSSSSTWPTAATRRCPWRWCWRATGVAAAGGHGAPTPPEGYGAEPQEAIVRDLITDTLTDASDSDLIEARGPRAHQEGDPEVDQEAHGRPCRGGPLPGRDGAMSETMNSADPVDYVPFEATVGPGDAGRRARPSRPRARSSACTTCRWSWPSRSAARA